MVHNLKQFCDQNGFKDVPAKRFQEMGSGELWIVYSELIDGTGKAETALGYLPWQFVRILQRHGYDPFQEAAQLNLDLAVPQKPVTS